MNEYKRLTERTQRGGVRYKRNGCLITVYPKNNNLTDIDKLALRLCDFEDEKEADNAKKEMSNTK